MKLNEHLNEGPVKLISHSCQDHVETLDLQIPLRLKDQPPKLTQSIHNPHQSLVELNEHPENKNQLICHLNREPPQIVHQCQESPQPNSSPSHNLMPPTDQVTVSHKTIQQPYHHLPLQNPVFPTNPQSQNSTLSFEHLHRDEMHPIDDLPFEQVFSIFTLNFFLQTFYYSFFIFY